MTTTPAPTQSLSWSTSAWVFSCVAAFTTNPEKVRLVRVSRSTYRFGRGLALTRILMTASKGPIAHRMHDYWRVVSVAGTLVIGGVDVDYVLRHVPDEAQGAFLAGLSDIRLGADTFVAVQHRCRQLSSLQLLASAKNASTVVDVAPEHVASLRFLTVNQSQSWQLALRGFEQGHNLTKLRVCSHNAAELWAQLEAAGVTRNLEQLQLELTLRHGESIWPGAVPCETKTVALWLACPPPPFRATCQGLEWVQDLHLVGCGLGELNGDGLLCCCALVSVRCDNVSSVALTNSFATLERVELRGCTVAVGAEFDARCVRLHKLEFWSFCLRTPPWPLQVHDLPHLRVLDVAVNAVALPAVLWSSTLADLTLRDYSRNRVPYAQVFGACPRLRSLQLLYVFPMFTCPEHAAGELALPRLTTLRYLHGTTGSTYEINDEAWDADGDDDLGDKRGSCFGLPPIPTLVELALDETALKGPLREVDDLPMRYPALRTLLVLSRRPVQLRTLPPQLTRLVLGPLTSFTANTYRSSTTFPSVTTLDYTAHPQGELRGCYSELVTLLTLFPNVTDLTLHVEDGVELFRHLGQLAVRHGKRYGTAKPLVSLTLKLPHLHDAHRHTTAPQRDCAVEPFIRARGFLQHLGCVVSLQPAKYVNDSELLSCSGCAWFVNPLLGLECK